MAATMIACLLVAPASAQRAHEGEDESAALVESGRSDLRARRYDDAARALDQAIALNPRRLDAYVLRAAVHAAKKEYDLGVALLRKAQKLDADNPDVLAALGSQLLLGGDTEQGIVVLEKVTAVDPHRYEAQELLGRHFARARDWARAIGPLEAYLDDRPEELVGEDALRQTVLAEAYLRVGQPRDAEKLYRRVLKVTPDEPAARMGLGWALAAIDCKKAKPVLAKLADLVADHPVVLLVRGQCDLALGDAKSALQAGQRYQAAIEYAGGTPTAAGYALVGEASFATGDLALAVTSLEQARDLEPGKRRWALKLAIVLRRSGDATGALAELERMGPPAEPAGDRRWWRELGETLIAAGRPEEVETRLAPALAALTDDAGLATIAGEAALRAGDATTALVHLHAAERLGESADRTEAWLVRADAAAAATAIAAGDLATAETLLAEADAHATARGIDDADVARNLGVVRLQLDRAADAVAPLERAASIDDAPQSHLALAQAYARTGAADRARAAYRSAAGKARGSLAVMVAIDLAAFELAAGQGADALDALDAASAAAAKAPEALADQYRQASLAARHAAGVAALRAGSAGRAVSLLEAADKLARGKDDGVRCDLALATVASGDRDKARKRLTAVKKVTCPFDTQAVPILLAFLDGLDVKHADRSLKALRKLEGKASGATRRLLATVTRMVALGAAEQAYSDGKLPRARKLLATAKRADTRAGADEIAHDLAVLDIADGKLADAAAALDKLTAKLPEALINLGVIADRRGDGSEALSRWRAARKAGARFGLLDDWIAAKERIFGKEDRP